VKGTKLWQGTGSPLIQGRSRQIRPFWQPWLSSALVALAAAMAVAWLWFHVLPIAPMVLGSFAAAAVGVYVARRLGSVRGWLQGLTAAIVVDAALFTMLLLWSPTLLKTI